MKSLNSVFALLIGFALLTAGAGCKHGPKATTPIIGRGVSPIDSGNTPLKPVLPPNTGGNQPVIPPGNTGDNAGKITDTKLPGDVNSTTVTTPPEKAGEQTSRPDMGNFNEDKEALKAESVHFDLDRATVKGSERPKLDRVAAYMKSEGSISLRVEGNCDERGTEDYNRSLGERRALSAREYLVNSGVAPERITTVTLGEDNPADTGHDESAWSKNRRADFIVLRPKTNVQ
jgi:peptidoglycan-associated lipoprotein